MVTQDFATKSYGPVPLSRKTAEDESFYASIFKTYSKRRIETRQSKSGRVRCPSFRATSTKRRIETSSKILKRGEQFGASEPLPLKEGLKPQYVAGQRPAMQNASEPLPLKEGLKQTGHEVFGAFPELLPSHFH